MEGRFLGLRLYARDALGRSHYLICGCECRQSNLDSCLRCCLKGVSSVASVGVDGLQIQSEVERRDVGWIACGNEAFSLRKVVDGARASKTFGSAISARIEKLKFLSRIAVTFASNSGSWLCGDIG